MFIRYRYRYNYLQCNVRRLNVLESFCVFEHHYYCNLFIFWIKWRSKNDPIHYHVNFVIAHRSVMQYCWHLHNTWKEIAYSTIIQVRQFNEHISWIWTHLPVIIYVFADVKQIDGITDGQTKQRSRSKNGCREIYMSQKILYDDRCNFNIIFEASACSVIT